MASVVENFVPPVSVAFEGQALNVVARLSRLATKLSGITPHIDEDGFPKLTEVRELLNEVIEVMTAVEATVTKIELGAEKIIESICDGCETGFYVEGDPKYFVGGILYRRNRVLSIRIVGINDNSDPSVSDKNEVVLFPVKFYHDRQRSLIKSAG